MTFNIESHINPIPKDRITNISDSKASKAKETYDTIKRSVSTAGQFAVLTITAISFLQKLRLVHKMADIGATNLLALKSFKHGTNFLSYLKICYGGADPTKGGARTGENLGCRNAIDNVFVWRDGVHRMSPSGYRYQSNRNLYNYGEDVQRIIMYAASKLGYRTTIRLYEHVANLAPILRFRFRSETKFVVDKTMPEAMSTCYKISPFRLGLPGALSVGLGKDMFGRMAKNPKKVLKGLVYLSAALYCAKLMFSHSTIKKSEKEDSKEISHTNKTHKEIGMQILRIGIARKEYLSYLPLISDNSKGSLAFNAFTIASKFNVLHYIINIIGNKKCNPPNLLSQYVFLYSLISPITSIARRSKRGSYKMELTFSLTAAYMMLAYKKYHENFKPAIAFAKSMITRWFANVPTARKQPDSTHPRLQIVVPADLRNPKKKCKAKT